MCTWCGVVKGFVVILWGNPHISGFHPFLLGWWNFPEKALPMSWLEGIILASTILRVERREKAEMSQILGHSFRTMSQSDLKEFVLAPQAIRGCSAVLCACSQMMSERKMAGGHHEGKPDTKTL